MNHHPDIQLLSKYLDELHWLDDCVQVQGSEILVGRCKEITFESTRMIDHVDSKWAQFNSVSFYLLENFIEMVSGVSGSRNCESKTIYYKKYKNEKTLAKCLMRHFKEFCELSDTICIDNNYNYFLKFNKDLVIMR